jgi:pentatricopeptide repeat protein
MWRVTTTLVSTKAKQSLIRLRAAQFTVSHTQEDHEAVCRDQKWLLTRNKTGDRSRTTAIDSPTLETRSQNEAKRIPADTHEDIRTLIKMARPMKVLHILDQQGICVDFFIYATLLRRCTQMKDMMEGKRVHAHIIKSGMQPDIYLGNTLLNMYANTGSVIDAHRVFDKLPRKDVVSWNTMIVGYAKHGYGEEAFRLFHQMQQEGFKPDTVTCTSILKACTGPRALEWGKHVHSHIMKAGYNVDVRVVTALISMYTKCGKNKEAFEVFYNMQEAGVEPDNVTYTSILNACTSPASLEGGRQVHAQIQKSRFDADVRLWNAIIGMYVKCGSIKEAFNMFHEMQQKCVEPDSITYMSILNACATPATLEWGKKLHANIRKSGLDSDVRLANALIGMYAKCGASNEAFNVFHQMHQEGAVLDRVTYICILKACASPMALELGRQVHAHIKKSGFDSDVRVRTALICMYVQCGSDQEAFEVFHHMQGEGVVPDKVTYMSILNAFASPAALKSGKQVHVHVRKSGLEHDLRLATALISMYARCGGYEEAFEMYHNMQQQGLELDNVAYISILNACASPAALEDGKEVHSNVSRSGFNNDVSVGNALMSMYSRCGASEEAFKVFDQMQRDGVEIDIMSYTCILKACASLAAISEGKQLHANIIQAGFGTDIQIGNALIDMYAKCGSLEAACQVFDVMPERDVISWTAMIVGLAQHGCGEEALQVFEQMRVEGVEPNAVTFVGVLSACSHAGLVEEAYGYFSSMCHQNGISPVGEHYGCMVDLLGRGGHLKEAEDLIKKMPVEADVTIWGSLLGACRTHGNVELAECTAENCLQLEPKDAAVYVLLSHIYAAAGMWGSVTKVRNTMKERGIQKEPGRCWIEVENKIHTFVAEDRTHPQTEEIYAELDKLTGQMKEGGYVADTRCVMHDVDEGEREQAICYHSERLAIVYGLISTEPGTPIHIFKNLRVCSDCHTATKIISKIVRREIVARDANRFHHFKDGSCSCGDYW